MDTIVSAWVQFCTVAQGAALLAVFGALIVAVLRLHYLTHRTAAAADADPVEGTLRAGRR